MIWLENRRRRMATKIAAREKKIEAENNARQECIDRYNKEYCEWKEAQDRARGKAEAAAERGDGQTALAWLKIADHINAPTYRPSKDYSDWY